MKNIINQENRIDSGICESLEYMKLQCVDGTIDYGW
jgi:hypothetical protein